MHVCDSRDVFADPAKGVTTEGADWFWPWLLHNGKKATKTAVSACQDSLVGAYARVKRFTHIHACNHPIHACLPEMLVLTGGAILPVPAVPASTRISARL